MSILMHVVLLSSLKLQTSFRLVWDGNIPYDTSRWDFADRLCARGFSDIVDVAVFNNRGCDDAWGLVTMVTYFIRRLMNCSHQTLRSCSVPNWMKRHVDVVDWAFSACRRGSEGSVAHSFVLIVAVVSIFLMIDCRAQRLVVDWLSNALIHSWLQSGLTL